MKKVCCVLLSALSIVSTSAIALAADVSVETTTLLGIAQRDVSGASKENILPATQFFGLQADSLADGNLSLHIYGWGRTDMGDRSYSTDKNSGNLTYAYVQYAPDYANASVRAGRFFVREGIINEQLDGLNARTDLPAGLGLSVFGGATVHTAKLVGEGSDGKGDTLYGGRLNYRYRGMLEVGVSGVFESEAPELIAHPAANYRRIGADVWLAPLKTVDVIGHSSYNPETKKMAEHSYLLNYKPAREIVLTGEFNQHLEQSYLYAWTMFSGATLNPDYRSTSFGLSASYEINKALEVAADYKHYEREFGGANRFGGDMRVHYKDNTIRGGVGYHYLGADEGFSITPYTSASYHELRCYTMRDSKNYFTAIDLLGNFFEQKIYGKSSAWEANASVGYHITPGLALSGDLSYGRNPQFIEEVKTILRLTYNMNYPGIGGKK
ncbi:MAG: hypothetical protein PHN84_11545 [Desulfuromonadaceae bacterium]|nr:hypothetical protein [Desulfuromonadaceae bacterium]MDD2854698.1 hypothetical protein [Desulfuromonadaceae bacterium]